MPIRNLTNQSPSFPEIGQLRKGAPKEKRKNQQGKEYETYGKDLTYFRFTTDIPEVQEAFDAAYSGEPRLINVFLPFRTVEENLDAWQEEYRAGGLVHRCDGETVILWQKSDGTYSHDSKPCEYASGKKQRTDKEPGCKPVARLKVIIPELGRLAFVTVLTTSRHDIRNLDAQLRALADLRGNRDLRGIPLQLRRRPHRISTPGTDGKRTRREKWLLSIEAAPDWVALQLASQAQAALPTVHPVAALPAPLVVNGKTGEIVAPDEWEDDEDGWVVEPVKVEQEPPPPDFTIVEIPAGKYKGASLGYLAKSDPAFLERAARESKDADLRASCEATLRWAGIWPQDREEQVAAGQAELPLDESPLDLPY